MFKSIIQDAKYSFMTGNMVTRLIILNVIVYIFAALIVAFSRGGPVENFLNDNFAISGRLSILMFRPWTILSHIFLHKGFWHLLFNMIGLHIFGRIVGDLVGDRRVLPIYIFGGVIGGLFYVLSYQLQIASGQYALGASAAVLAIAATAAFTAPDYSIRLLLIGDVKIKYIVLVFIFFDVIGAAGSNNVGGHIAHLGGVLAGIVYYRLMGTRSDITFIFEKIMSFLALFNKKSRSKKSKLRVKHRSEYLGQRKNDKSANENYSMEEDLNRILDKIKAYGYDKLSKEEKDFLKNYSKEN